MLLILEFNTDKFTMVRMVKLSVNVFCITTFSFFFWGGEYFFTWLTGSHCVLTR